MMLYSQEHSADKLTKLLLRKIVAVSKIINKKTTYRYFSHFLKKVRKMRDEDEENLSEISDI